MVEHTVFGHIIAIQEERFRLELDSGETFLLTLAKNAHAHPSDLQQLFQSNAHVAVKYKGLPNLTTGVAHSIEPLENGHAPRSFP